MSDVWLGRFRVSGTNWEGRDWFLVPGLVVLADQISQAYPEDQPGDGTVASRPHDDVSPNSDHRPTPHTEQRHALVRALDAGETTNEIGERIVDAIVESRDPRLMYVIYERKSVWSVPHNGYPAWTPQPYLGPAPHTGHFHLSTKRTKTADNDTRPWQIGEPMPNIEEIRAVIREELDRDVEGNPGQPYSFYGIGQRVITTLIGRSGKNLGQQVQDIWNRTKGA